MSIDRNQCWPISRIKPHPGNARKHSKGQVQALASSMSEYDQTMPILVDDQGVIIAGHGRYEAAKAAKRKEVWVSIANGWDEAKKRRYRLLDNQLGDMSEWDMNMLSTELDDLGGIELGGFDVDFGIEGTPYTEDNNAAPVASQSDPEDRPAAAVAPEKSSGVRVPLLIELTQGQNKRWKELKLAAGMGDNKSAFLHFTGIADER